MGAETNDLDTRDEDKARTEGRLVEFWEEDKNTSYEDTMDMASKYIDKYRGF
ncbi:MAG: hypothetical protein WC332_00695 [Clostridia bacterium]|jgi:hypothetical protein